MAAVARSLFSAALKAPLWRVSCQTTARYSQAFHTGKFFTKKHEWVDVRYGVGIVGISDHAQESLGDIVFVDLVEPGKKVKQGDIVGAIESVKAASDIYSPVSGTVTERNDELEENPALVNKSVYEKGWLLKIQLEDENEVANLLNAEQYAKFLAEEAAQEDGH